MKIEINKLNPHPYNRKVYGFDENITELTNRIRESNWVKPILINKHNMIISGHRRVEACKALGIESVEFEYTPDDPIVQLELFLNENQYREKTNLQKTREAEIYMDIERKKAYNRMIEAGKQNLNNSSAVKTFPPLAEGKPVILSVTKWVYQESPWKKAKKSSIKWIQPTMTSLLSFFKTL